MNDEQLAKRWPGLYAAGRIGFQDPHRPFSQDPSTVKESTDEILAQRAKRKRESEMDELGVFAHSRRGAG